MVEYDDKDRGDGLKACLRCGKLVSGADSFCNSCGADLKASPVPGQAGAVDPADFGGPRQVYTPPSQYTGPGAAPAPPSYPAGGYTAAAQAYPSYQGPPPPYYPAVFKARRTDELAIISLICGIGSFAVFPLLPAIAAIILGLVSRDRIRSSPETLEGEGMALTGIILGIANLVIVVAVFIVIALVALADAAPVITMF